MSGEELHAAEVHTEDPDGPAELALQEELRAQAARGRGRIALLPFGERIELPGRGTTFVRRVQGPPGGPTVVLLHGWIASGGLNWFQAFGPLGDVATVLAPDLRGHGRGIRNRRRFRLADCADDVAALCEHLGTGPVIPVGYSMGGPVAQLLWKRHPDLVAGLVLVATADHFVPTVRARLIFTTLMSTAASTSRLGAVVSHLPRQLAMQVVPYTTGTRPGSLSRWASEEMRRHDLRLLFEAGAAIGTYDARRWIRDVDVPTAVVVTTRDRAVTPAQQAGMAFRIAGSQLHQIEDGHLACAAPDFGAHLVRAVQSVAGDRSLVE